MFSFLRVDTDQPWFNIRNGDLLNKEDVGEEVVLPEHLKPHLRRIPFILVPSRHRVLFDTAKMAPNTMGRFMHRLLNHDDVRGKVDEVTVVVQQEERQVEAILSMHELRSLTINVTQPNPDELGGLDEEIKERMKRERIKELEERLRARKGRSIVPSERTKAMAMLAAKEGWVSGRGRPVKGALVKTITTVDSPKIVEAPMNPDIQSEVQAIDEYARRAFPPRVRE